MTRPSEIVDGSTAIAYPPCAPSVVRTMPPCLRVDMICSRNLGGRLLRSARVAKGTGAPGSRSPCRTRSIRARIPYSDLRESRIVDSFWQHLLPVGWGFRDRAVGPRLVRRTHRRRAPDHLASADG